MLWKKTGTTAKTKKRKNQAVDFLKSKVKFDWQNFVVLRYLWLPTSTRETTNQPLITFLTNS